MGLSHPIVWIVCAVLGVLFAALLGVVRVFGAVAKRRRSSRWAEERDRRRTWKAVVLDVESARRINEAGDFLVVVAERRDDANLGLSYPERRKAIVRVPPPWDASFEATTSLPVLVSPESPDVVVVDYGALTGDRGIGDEVAREVYVHATAWKWQRIA